MRSFENVVQPIKAFHNSLSLYKTKAKYYTFYFTRVSNNETARIIEDSRVERYKSQDIHCKHVLNSNKPIRLDAKVQHFRTLKRKCAIDKSGFNRNKRDIYG